MLLGTALFIVGTVVMLTAHHSVVAMTAMVVVVSVATAFAYTAIPNLIVESVPEHNTSETTGTNAVLRTAGQGVGTSIATMLLAFAATPLAGINMVGIMLIVLSVVTVGLTLLIPRTTRAA